MLSPRMPQRRAELDGASHHRQELPSAQLSHCMDSADLDCPMNWPLHRKLYTSAAAWLFTFAVVNGLTCYTAGLSFVVSDFDFNPDNSPTYLPIAPTSGFSLYLFGVMFAPIVTPHIVERVGRSIVYFTCITLCGVFLLSAGFAQSFAGVAILRFFAGLFGGPCVVNIEGTFADIWSDKTTNTFYAFLGIAQFFGAGLGPLVGGFIVQATNGWRWTQFFSAALCALVGIFGIGISESYQREIPRRRAKRQGHVIQQDPALSGVTIGQMLRTTVFDPIVQVFTEPVVMMTTFILVFNFAVVMQFIITVPVALGTPPPGGPGFSIAHVGVAFTTAFGGAALAALFNIMIEQAVIPILSKRNVPDFVTVEYRLIPSMFGTIFVTASLFWIGATVGNPNFKPVVPIVGTAVFVLGVAMILLSVVPYLFDAFEPAGTLSALTAGASGRLFFAGWLPLVILYFFTGVTPKWALFIFGFISIPVWAIPLVLFHYGPMLRDKSKFSNVPTSDAMQLKPSHSSDEEAAHGPITERLRSTVE